MYGEYLKNCSEMEVQPDNNQISDLLRDALAEAQASAELFI
jgi:hypothetical protein